MPQQNATSPAIGRMVTLGGQVLQAAVVAAFVGSLLYWVGDAVARTLAGIDAPFCPLVIATLRVSGVACAATAALTGTAFVLCFAVLSTPFALIVTLPVGACLGAFVPMLERRWGSSRPGWIGRTPATLVGALTGAAGALGGSRYALVYGGASGALAAGLAVAAFYRTRYGPRKKGRRPPAPPLP